MQENQATKLPDMIEVQAFDKNGTLHSVYINPFYIVSAAPMTHETFGPVVAFQTINSTILAKQGEVNVAA